jgi:hypothetical protein
MQAEQTECREDGGEHDSIGDPAHERREEREPEQLHEQMKHERWAPADAQIV